MRIIFMGTPDFAVASLKKLVEEGENVVAVVTATDKLGGRGGKQLLQSPVKLYALSQGIPVLQPERLKSKEFINQLKEYKADVQIVVAFRMLPEVIWNMPARGTFNLHGSLLPKYRGAAPINWAIIRGEKVTGVTSFKLKQEIDTGDWVLREEVPIFESDTAGTVHDRMMLTGADVVFKTIQMLKDGNIVFQAQNDGDASLAPKIFHEDCQINFDHKVEDIYNFIRGLSPYPGAYFFFNGLETKILQCKPVLSEHKFQNGFVDIGKKYFHVYCVDGYINITELKMEGKRQMSVTEFLNGWKQ